MAESFRLVKYFDLPKFLEVLGSFFFWSLWEFFSYRNWGDGRCSQFSNNQLVGGSDLGFSGYGGMLIPFFPELYFGLKIRNDQDTFRHLFGIF